MAIAGTSGVSASPRPRVSRRAMRDAISGYLYITPWIIGFLVFTLLIGGLVKTVGYSPFFVALGVLDIVAAIWLWTVVREPRSAPPQTTAATAT